LKGVAKNDMEMNYETVEGTDATQAETGLTAKTFFDSRYFTDS
jgi:hypothetical protein